MDMMARSPFSPSNVKRVMRSGGVESFTASPAASTVKRSNIRKSSSKKQVQTIDSRLGERKYDNIAYTHAYLSCLLRLTGSL
jgi:hypothetical protein